MDGLVCGEQHTDHRMQRADLRDHHMDRGRQRRERERPSHPRVWHEGCDHSPLSMSLVRGVCWSMTVLGVRRESRVVRLTVFLSMQELVYER